MLASIVLLLSAVTSVFSAECWDSTSSQWSCNSKIQITFVLVLRNASQNWSRLSTNSSFRSAHSRDNGPLCSWRGGNLAGRSDRAGPEVPGQGWRRSWPPCSQSCCPGWCARPRVCRALRSPWGCRRCPLWTSPAWQSPWYGWDVIALIFGGALIDGTCIEYGTACTEGTLASSARQTCLEAARLNSEQTLWKLELSHILALAGARSCNLSELPSRTSCTTAPPCLSQTWQKKILRQTISTYLAYLSTYLASPLGKNLSR